ncbi:glycosyltransferase [Runella sp. SP2]|uniref:glycosyltransferase family 8 protein n=1 Tax=Runella sp. SP2 TaxID=2268026 RepID=UPI000F090A49|nr:glycosyltransferase [Runella sp. SP2]AYQ31190.1 glycosyltransferase family 8 protein [Runella sp. SP2]
MNIVFCINQLGLEGLGSTLISLLRNCSNSSEITFWFLCSEMTAEDKKNITTLLSIEKFNGQSNFIDFDAKKSFGHLRSLHGDWTTYGKLLIPQKINGETALYLDSDLIIKLDILTLKNIKFNGELLGAVYGGHIEKALTHNFFIQKLNWHPETGNFNAGVLVFNIKTWKEMNIDFTWPSLALKYSNYFLDADQTLLNLLCKGNFLHLQSHFNSIWFPNAINPFTEEENAIFHLVGSPKPWDITGSLLNSGFKIWKKYDDDFWKSKYNKITINKLKRTWNIRKSIARHFVSKFIYRKIN